MADALLDRLDRLPLGAVLLAVGVVMAMETTMLVGVVVPGDLVVLFAASRAAAQPPVARFAAPSSSAAKATSTSLNGLATTAGGAAVGPNEPDVHQSTAHSDR